GPAVEAALLNRSEIIGRGLVPQPVAFVDHRPQRAGRGLPGHADRVAETRGIYAARARREIDFVNAGPALLLRHAAVGDVPDRSHGDVEPAAVGAEDEVARPVAAGPRIEKLLRPRRDLRLAGLVRVGDGC